METSSFWKPLKGFATRVGLGIFLSLALLTATVCAWTVSRARGA